MKVLTVWHKLLIYFIRQKNEILRNITGITYVSRDDIMELATWSKTDVIKVLDNLSSEADICNCPWCILYRDVKSKCKNCEYGKRNVWCESPDRMGNYRKILTNLRERKIIGETNPLTKQPEGLTNVRSIVALTDNVKFTYRAMHYILV